MIMTIVRKFTAVFLALSLCMTTVACGGGNQTTSPTKNVSQTSTNTKLSDGEYQIQ